MNRLKEGRFILTRTVKEKCKLDGAHPKGKKNCLPHDDVEERTRGWRSRSSRKTMTVLDDFKGETRKKIRPGRGGEGNLETNFKEIPVGTTLKIIIVKT